MVSHNTMGSLYEILPPLDTQFVLPFPASRSVPAVRGRFLLGDAMPINVSTLCYWCGITVTAKNKGGEEDGFPVCWDCVKNNKFYEKQNAEWIEKNGPIFPRLKA